MKIGSGKYANLYDIKKEMKEGKFDPKNPSIHIHGLGVYNLKLLEKVIKRDLTSRANDLGGELAAKNLNILFILLFIKNMKNVWAGYGEHKNTRTDMQQYDYVSNKKGININGKI